MFILSYKNKQFSLQMFSLAKIGLYEAKRKHYSEHRYLLLD